MVLSSKNIQMSVACAVTSILMSMVHAACRDHTNLSGLHCYLRTMFKLSPRVISVSEVLLQLDLS
ncbi:hypothetical protein I79_002451 [Cricetulus griseus]|uniref:Uncharacterized protein n=1 Tax=Cricetulus griseus TaxID=10029 RepID=G3GXG2_CRIGR|nr:hypothetical protein I79_002451 [Cricetulus griseus]